MREDGRGRCDGVRGDRSQDLLTPCTIFVRVQAESALMKTLSQVHVHITTSSNNIVLDNNI